LFRFVAEAVGLGQNHSAFITVDGNLYTFGSGKFGCLGLDDNDRNHLMPHRVEYFASQNLRVKEVVLG